MGRRFPPCCHKLRQKRHLLTSCTFLLCTKIPQDYQKLGNNIGMQIHLTFRRLALQHCSGITENSSHRVLVIFNVSSPPYRKRKKHLSVKGLYRVGCSGLVFGKYKSTTQKILLHFYQPTQSNKINVIWSVPHWKQDVKEYKMLLGMRQTFYAADVDGTGELISTFPPEIHFYADPLLSICLLIHDTIFYIKLKSEKKFRQLLNAYAGSVLLAPGRTSVPAADFVSWDDPRRWPKTVIWHLVPKRQDCYVQEGHILFIPHLWWRNVPATHKKLKQP